MSTVYMVTKGLEVRRETENCRGGGGGSDGRRVPCVCVEGER